MRGLALVRMPRSVTERMESLLVCRYPYAEWMTFIRFGWTVRDGKLLVTVSELVEPRPGDLDDSVGHVRIDEPYSLRAVLAAERDQLGLGVIHSHPEGCAPRPSEIDDDMDAYYANYFESFLGPRPYVSLIFSRDGSGRRAYSGRAWLGGKEYAVDKVVVVGDKIDAVWCSRSAAVPTHVARRTGRAADTYGREAMNRLWNSTVAVVGVGGTGSAAAHVLARSGIGRLVLVDDDRLDETNIERVHGSYAEDAPVNPLKVVLARDNAKRICPEMDVVPVVGNCLHLLAQDFLLQADLILSCTDTNHSRVGLAELAYRYGVPVIDVAVQLEGRAGIVGAEVIQFTRYAPGLPCPYCRNLVNAWRLQVELMSDGEKQRRCQEAAAAVARGEPGDAYWRGEPPQILTVGHLTSAAGSMAAAYALNMLAGTAMMPDAHFQIDILRDGFDFVSVNATPRGGCACAEVQCRADQAAARSVISAPSHWAPARLA